LSFRTRRVQEYACAHPGSPDYDTRFGWTRAGLPGRWGAVFVSPRSNYQTVAQEVARIRSRARDLKEALFLVYSGTEEQAKARRLADHLRQDKYLGNSLFELEDVPTAFADLASFESRYLVLEESL
jgi:hypothetical protein